ncbi:MAG: hypothetical protein D3926_11310, partial [Desulfobacteraceae bacterium]
MRRKTVSIFVLFIFLSFCSVFAENLSKGGTQSTENRLTLGGGSESGNKIQKPRAPMISTPGQDNPGSPSTPPEFKPGTYVKGGDEGQIPDTKNTVDSALWNQLALMPDSSRFNALISIQLGPDPSSSALQAAGQAETYWSEGRYDQAIDQIKNLELSGEQLNLGIRWKRPKALDAPSWVTNDGRIGTRTDVDKTILDYDAQTGNLFAVLKYRNGSSTFWYWSVNISTDQGKTWQETYEWWARYEFSDVSAVVVDDYLWVGYVRFSDNSGGYMMRFAVADGSEDTSYNTIGYSQVFDKNQPIKEVSLSGNADSTDDRVYYSAILDNSTSLLAMEKESSPAPYVHPVISKVRVEPGSQEEMIEAMETHPKLKAAPLILDDFS